MANEQQPRQPSEIRSLEQLEEGVRNLRADYRETAFYFRGESQAEWPLKPSLFRCRLVEHESQMLHDLMISRPIEFKPMHSAFTQWSLAQHHGLPTRFLDLTSRPEVALFFACGGYDNDKSGDGRVRVFAAPESQVKQHDSDAVSIVANFAKLSSADQANLLTGGVGDIEKSNERLIKLIRNEISYFLDRIDVQDFDKVFIVEPGQPNERVEAQGGAFLLSARHERFEASEVVKQGQSPIYQDYNLTIPMEYKERILEELRAVNVTKETLFPGLDSSSRMITTRYSQAERASEYLEE